MSLKEKPLTPSIIVRYMVSPEFISVFVADPFEAAHEPSITVKLYITPCGVSGDAGLSGDVGVLGVPGVVGVFGLSGVVGSLGVSCCV